ncbi:MAG: DUF1800 domain-containing protein, partial [Candidatus Kapabacteria bacterium]|nr:DUF1800 domain-containing protein [Candidatus Kapabacteria bacterium]
MTLFWHNLLVSAYPAVQDARYMYRQNQLLRRFALGNIRQLLKEITIDPAMLRYLNGNTNTKHQINENYGRELQELFTIGKGPEIAPGNYTHYTEQDVRAAARVLTGWTDDPETVSSRFVPEHHVTEDKQFSSAYQNTVIKGRSGADGARETDELLDMIFRQEETARFFSRKLYIWFVGTEIDATIEREVITPMAATLRASNWEVKPVLHLLLRSQHFLDMDTVGSIVKSPIDLVIGTVNYVRQYFTPALPSLDSDPIGYYSFAQWLWQSADAQEMGILNHPNVAGWKAYYQAPLYDKLWINTATLAARNDFTEKLINGVMIETGSGMKRFAIDSIAMAKDLCANPGNGDDLVDKLSADLVGVPLTPAQKLYLMDEILAPGFFNARGAWDMNWSFYVAAPNDPAKRQAVQSRIDNVVKFVLHMPEAHIA